MGLSFLFLEAVKSATIFSTCQFKSYHNGLAILHKCDRNASDTIKLVGNNTSPCRARDSIEKLLQNISEGELVNIKVELFNHGSNGGATSSWDLIAGSTASGNYIETPDGCNSTHIYYFGQRK
jgi:hypothetical protein